MIYTRTYIVMCATDQRPITSVWFCSECRVQAWIARAAEKNVPLPESVPWGIKKKSKIKTVFRPGTIIIAGHKLKCPCTILPQQCVRVLYSCGTLMVCILGKKITTKCLPRQPVSSEHHSIREKEEKTVANKINKNINSYTITRAI